MRCNKAVGFLSSLCNEETSGQERGIAGDSPALRNM
jgi:hypothetical protein